MKFTLGDLSVGFSEGSFYAGRTVAQKKSWADLHKFFDKVLKGDSFNEKTNVADQLKEYRSWAYDCINVITNRSSSIGFRFVNTSTGQEIKPGSTRYDIISKPILKPNPHMTWRFLHQWMQSQLDLTGMCFALILNNKLEKPFELWPLNVGNFDHIKRDKKTGQPASFVFKYEHNKVVEYPADNILYVWYPNPEDPWLPMSPIQAHARVIDIDKYIEIYERRFFKNSARYDIALATEAKLDENEANRMREMWEAKFQGPENAHRVAVLHSGLQAVPLEVANKDFEFANLAAWTKDKILAAYGVPEAKLGHVKDVNRSTSFEVDVTFNREAITPRLNIWEDQLNRKIFHKFDERLEIRFDNPVPSDKEELDKEIRDDIKVGLLTLNEGRKMKNREPMDGGDVLVLPRTYVPITMLGEITAGFDNQNLDPNKNDPKSYYSKEVLTKRWNLFDRRNRLYELMWYPKLNAVFTRQRDEVIANLNRSYPKKGYKDVTKASIQSFLFDYGTSETELKREARKVYEEIVEQEGEIALHEVGVFNSFDIADPHVQAYFAGKTLNLSKQILTTRQDELKKTLQEAIDNGEELGKVVKRVEAVYEGLLDGRWEAERIARTECIGAANFGALEGYKQSGVVEGKGWLASPDDRTRETHIIAGMSYDEKGAIPLDQDFVVGGGAGPCPGSIGLPEEDIECRCSIFPVVIMKAQEGS